MTTASLHSPINKVLDTTTLADDGGLNCVWTRGASGAWGYAMHTTAAPAVAMTSNAPATTTEAQVVRLPWNVLDAIKNGLRLASTAQLIKGHSVRS